MFAQWNCFCVILFFCFYSLKLVSYLLQWRQEHLLRGSSSAWVFIARSSVQQRCECCPCSQATWMEGVHVRRCRAWEVSRRMEIPSPFPQGFLLVHTSTPDGECVHARCVSWHIAAPKGYIILAWPLENGYVFGQLCIL